VGHVLSASTGTWTESPTSYAYRWERCYSFWWTGTQCVAIHGANGPNYTIGRRDLGSKLRVAVIATNSAGSATADSRETAFVWFEF